MKRALSIVLMLNMIIGMFCFPAFVSAAQQFSVPSDWQLLIEEDFGNEADGTLAEEDTLLTQYSTNHTWVDNSTYSKKPSVLTDGTLALFCKGGSGSGNGSIATILETPIDLSKDADYYIMMDSTFPAMNTGGTNVTFSDSASSNRKVTVGGSQNNSPLAPATSWTTSGDARTRNANKDKTYATGKMQTMVALIAARPNGTTATNGKNGVIKIRFFNPDEGEAPSFTPSYWDVQYMLPVHEASNANTNPPNPLAKFDTITISATTNQGSEIVSRIDNFYVYQAAPMSSYVTKLNNSVTNYKNSLSQAVVPAMKIPTTATATPPPTSIYFDVPPATNAAGNPQTVIRQGWYTEGSDEPLTTSNVYVIPQSMAGKLLKAVVVVRDDVTLEETTYNPYIGYVRNDFDYSGMKYSFKRNTTNLSGYQPDATDIVFTATLNMNEAYNTNYAAGTFALVIAQYGADGILKEIKTFPKATGAFTNAVASSKALTGTVSLANSVPGDTFRAFVWRSNANTITSGVDDFSYDIILPLDTNRNSFMIQNTFTIPE